MAKTIKHLSFNDQSPTGMDFIEIDHHYARTKKNLSNPHRASFYCIIWLISGEMIHQVDFNLVTVKVSSLLFVRKDAVQFFDQEHLFLSQVLIFTDEFFCTAENDHQMLKNGSLFNDLTSESGTSVIAAGPGLKLLWQQMTDEFWHGADQYRSPLLQSYLRSFILKAEREKSQEHIQSNVPNPQLNRLILFRDLLEQHFRELQPVSFYAEKLGLTNKVLTNALLKTMGKTSKQIADDRLMLEARRMLVYTDKSSKMIGFELGFGEPTNFIKFFRHHARLTPTAFRQKYNQRAPEST